MAEAIEKKPEAPKEPTKVVSVVTKPIEPEKDVTPETTAASIEKTEPAKTVETKETEKAVAKEEPVFAEDTWMFHKTHEPKLFKKGETIPDDWSLNNQWGWYKDIKNNFHWRK